MAFLLFTNYSNDDEFHEQLICVTRLYSCYSLFVLALPFFNPSTPPLNIRGGWVGLLYKGTVI